MATELINTIEKLENKSKSDLKEYEIIEFCSGLQCLLVSTLAVHSESQLKDFSTLKGAAALTVQAGSFADPIECGGLAHFLEHMVFMGSDKYPAENSYDSFVSSHGGSCNAMTEGEFTTYQFDVTADHFPEALDIFAHCISAPLLSMSASEREINSIENEFNLARNDDGVRLQEIVCLSCDPENVVRKFTWGNLYSLVTVTSKLNIDMHAALVQFYRTHYRPENCRLVVVAPHSLEQLLELVVTSFGTWRPPPYTPADLSPPMISTVHAKNGRSSKKATKKSHVLGKPVPAVHLPSMEETVGPWRQRALFRDESAYVVTRIAGIKNAHKLHLAWALSPVCHCYRSQPHHYVSHLLGHEGRGSLLSCLKEEGLATAVSAGVPHGGFDDNSMYSVFWVTITLTVQGLANWVMTKTMYVKLQRLTGGTQMLVAKRVHQCLDELRRTGPQRWVFDELHHTAQMRYDFLDEEDEADLAERLSIEMAPYMARRREDILTAAHLLWDWDPAAVQALLDDFTPAVCRLFISSSLYSGKSELSDHSGEQDNERDSGGEEQSEEESEQNEGDEDDSSGTSGSDAESVSSKLLPDLEEQAASVHVPLEQLYLGPSEWLDLVKPPNPSSALVEPRFCTKYWQNALPVSLMEMWSSNYTAGAASYKKSRIDHPSTDDSLSSATYPPPPGLPMHLPPVNEFIATRFELVLTPQTSGTSDKVVPPVKVFEEPGLCIWHKVDNEVFKVPKSELFLRFSSAAAMESATSATLLDLFVKLAADFLTETLYLASMADLGCAFSRTDVGFVMRVSGFSDKAVRLTDHVLGQLYRPHTLVTEHSFHRQSEILHRLYANEVLKAAHAAKVARLLALKPSRYSSKAKQSQLTSPALVNAAAVVRFAETFFSSTTVEVLVQGNATKDETVSLSSSIKGVRTADVLEDSHGNRDAGDHAVVANHIDMSLSVGLNEESPPQAIVCLPQYPVTVVLTTSPENPSERNVCVEIYYQLHAYKLVSLTRLDLLGQLLTEPFFDSLRTKQQLGYSVSCGVRDTYGVLGFGFQLVSASHGISDLLSALLLFIHSVPTLIGELPAASFEDNLQALRSSKLESPKSLSESADNNWQQIDEKRYNFHCREEQAEILLNRELISQQQMVNFSSALFLGMDRRMMIVEASRGGGAVLPEGPEGVYQCVVISDPSQLHWLPGTTMYPNLA